MIEEEKLEYRRFRKLEKLVSDYQPINRQQRHTKLKEFKKENYVYISYDSKDDLWRDFWKNIDLSFFNLPLSEDSLQASTKLRSFYQKKKLANLNLLLLMKKSQISCDLSKLNHLL